MKIEKNGIEVTLKQNYLSAGQISNLMREAIKIYEDGEFLDNYGFNPIDMEINFYAGLFYYTIENYDLNDNEKFDELFNAGIHDELLEKVANAKMAYNLMWKTAKEIGNPMNFILNMIGGFLGNLPENEDLVALADKLPDEWKQVKTEYDEIIGNRVENKEE